MFAVVFIISCILTNYCILGNAIKIDKADVEFFDKDYMTVDVKVRHENEKSLVDIEAELLQDVEKDVFMQLHIEKKIDGAFETMYKSDEIDRCHFAENREKYPVENALSEDFHKYGNLLQSCPLKKGHYYLRGFHFEPRGVIAEKISAGEFCIHFIMLKKIDGENKKMFSIRWYASV